MTPLATTIAKEILDWLADALEEIGNDRIDDSSLDIVMQDRLVRLSASVVRGETIAQ